MLFVVASGNTGRDGASSIQDPANCKSPMAVGASLSYGSDIRNNEMGIDYLADYSSRGPARDGRMKPDICAPDHFVLAAKTDPLKQGECDEANEPNVEINVPGGLGVEYVTGTSMTAPALAGSAAILRQYSQDGYCNDDTGKCCGSKGCGTTIHPSGSLMKAVLMNGAQPLTGGVQYVPGGDILEDQPLKPYDSNQGMGRVNLLNSVPLQGENKMSMLMVDDEFIVNGDKNTYTVYADKSGGCSGKLSATLAWYDPPGAIGCTTCVVNDLDLSVKLSSGVVKHPNGRNYRDSLNTVERVQTSVTEGEQIKIIVEAKNFAYYGQKFSLVITGCFSEDEPTQQNEPPPTPQQTKIPTKEPTKNPSNHPTKKPTSSVTWGNSNRATSTCPDRLFRLVMTPGDNGPQITWNVVASVDNSSPIEIMSGSDYQKNTQYIFSKCLDLNTRYRFKMTTKDNADITGRFKLTYGGPVIFSSSWPSQGLGHQSIFRFKTDAIGVYQQLGSNSFKTRVKLSDETEILGGFSVDAGVMPSSYGRSNKMFKPMPKSIERSTPDAHEEDEELKQLEYEEIEGLPTDVTEGGDELVGAAMEHFPSSTKLSNGDDEYREEAVGEVMEHMPPANAVESASDAEDGEEDAGDAFEHSIPDNEDWESV